MRAVDRPLDESKRLRQTLAAKAGLTLARRTRRAAGSPLIQLDDQVRLFLADYHDGFADAAYVAEHRQGRRRAKRHRDPAIAEAARLLGRGEMTRLIAASNHPVVMARVQQLLEATSLVTKRQLAPLGALDAQAVRQAVNALNELLGGNVDIAAGMQAWIDALATSRKGVSWALATAVVALVQPDRHLCVRDTVLRQQARWMAPQLKVSKTARGDVYARLRKMALHLVDELKARDLEPRDLLDVYDFVWLTLRPAARKRIAALPPVAADSQVRARHREAPEMTVGTDPSANAA
jgi:hypothetical protein